MTMFVSLKNTGINVHSKGCCLATALYLVMSVSLDSNCLNFIRQRSRMNQLVNGNDCNLPSQTLRYFVSPSQLASTSTNGRELPVQPHSQVSKLLEIHKKKWRKTDKVLDAMWVDTLSGVDMLKIPWALSLKRNLLNSSYPLRDIF